MPRSNSIRDSVPSNSTNEEVYPPSPTRYEKGIDFDSFLELIHIMPVEEAVLLGTLIRLSSDRKYRKDPCVGGFYCPPQLLESLIKLSPRRQTLLLKNLSMRNHIDINFHKVGKQKLRYITVFYGYRSPLERDLDAYRNGEV